MNTNFKQSSAYELAKALQETEPYYLEDDKLFDNAANMIRQQADRIAKLEQNLSAYIVELELQKAMIQDLERQLKNV